jgi:hypothetical protein
VLAGTLPRGVRATRNTSWRQGTASISGARSCERNPGLGPTGGSFSFRCDAAGVLKGGGAWRRSTCLSVMQ